MRVSATRAAKANLQIYSLRNIDPGERNEEHREVKYAVGMMNGKSQNREFSEDRETQRFELERQNEQHSGSIRLSQSQCYLNKKTIYRC